MVLEILMILYTPCSSSCSDTHCQNVNLFHSTYFSWYATHGLPSASSCTTPYLQLGCQQSDARGLPIQVPAWDLDPNLQDQGWGKTWLSTLHPGQRGLCCHGQMGTSGWWTQEWPHEVLRLHREHVRRWDLTMSPCLWAGRHHKEVWWIHGWASKLDMPTHPQGTNWQWQWHCNRVQSSTQADLGNPRCWHWAAQTTLKVSHDKRVLHLLEICRTYYAVESGAAAMCAGHVVHAVCHTCQAHDSKLQMSYAPCPNCTCQHPPSRHNCPTWHSACKGCGKKGHWWAKCHSSNTTSPQASHHQPQFKTCEKGRESQAAKAKTEKRPPHKDLFIAAMDCRTVGDVHPKEMVINNISSQQCSEAYTVIKLPASASSKGTASVCVKIDTRSGGNILPLFLFQQLHLKQTSPDGQPISLDPIWTKLTAYDGSLIPLYGILCGPSSGNQTLLQPNHAWSTHTGTLQTHLVQLSWVSKHARS